MLLGIGCEPYELMLQLLAKRDDPFSGGRSYYSHPSLNVLIDQKFRINRATGMQAIPATGMAQGVRYLERTGQLMRAASACGGCVPLGDGSITEGEVSEAWQFAVLKQLPIIYLVQDNDWGISVAADEESRTMDAYEYAAGFKGLKRVKVDGSDFIQSWDCMKDAIDYVRTQRKPILVHAKVPLLGHHTSGVRKEWYRSEEDLKKHYENDPFPKLRNQLVQKAKIAEATLNEIEERAKEKINNDFERAVASPDPEPESVTLHEFAEQTVTKEQGTRSPEGREKVVMVDAALHAVDEILKTYPEAIFFGQDVGRRLGGVFREAATLAEKYGDERVFNTAIQEAYIVGSTAGLSAVGVKPIVEIQFADYIWTGVNQLVTELSKSCYLTMGKFPVQ